MLSRISVLHGANSVSPTSMEVMDYKALVKDKTQQLNDLVSAIINETEEVIDTLAKSTGEQEKKEDGNNLKSILYTEYKEVLKVIGDSHHGWHYLNEIAIKSESDNESLDSLLNKLLEQLQKTEPSLSTLQKVKLVTRCFPEVGEKFQTFQQNCNDALASLDEPDKADESVISFLLRVQKNHLLPCIYQSSKNLSLVQQANKVLGLISLDAEKNKTPETETEKLKTWALTAFGLVIKDVDAMHFQLCKNSMDFNDKTAINNALKLLCEGQDEDDFILLCPFPIINDNVANKGFPNPLILATAHHNFDIFIALLNHPLLKLPFVTSGDDLLINSSKLVFGDNIFHLIARNSCMSLLSYLCSEACSEIKSKNLESLLEFINKTNNSGFTPYQLACHLGSVSIAIKLLQLGANPKALTPNNNTVLHMLATREHDKFCFFVKYWKQSEHFKADDLNILLNQQNKNGNTAIHIACMHGNAAIAIKLLQLGANPNALTSNSNNVLHLLAVVKEYDGFCQFVDGLENNDLNTLLHQQNKNGNTAIQIACMHGNTAIAIKLLQHGATPNALTSNSNTVLHLLAAVRGCSEFCQFVDCLKADDLNTLLNQQNKNGNTAIHIACMHGNAAIVFKLLVLGCNKEVKNKQGATPLESAKKLSQPYTKKLIIELLTAEPSQLADFKSKVTEFTSASDYEQEQMTKENATTVATLPTTAESKHTEFIPATDDEIKQLPVIEITPPSPTPVSKQNQIETTSKTTELARAETVPPQVNKESLTAQEVRSAHVPMPRDHQTPLTPKIKGLKLSNEINLTAGTTDKMNSSWTKCSKTVKNHYHKKLEQFKSELTAHFTDGLPGFIERYMKQHKLSLKYQEAMTAKQANNFLKILINFLRHNSKHKTKEFIQQFETYTKNQVQQHINSNAKNILKISWLESYEREVNDTILEYFSCIKEHIESTKDQIIRQIIDSLGWRVIKPVASLPTLMTTPIDEWLSQELG